MPVIKIQRKDTVKELRCEENSNLLKVLQRGGIRVYSPCGGKGTCGKCRVHLKSVGEIISCQYKVIHDIEVIIPEEREAHVLLDQHKYTVPVVLNPGKEINLSDKPHGVAIDLGTTTLAFYLADLKDGKVLANTPAINPQTQHGADVISRINYTAENKDGLKHLQQEIIEEINNQLRYLIDFSGINKDDVVKITISGNTTMLHLLLGIDPLPIALVPFTPAFTSAQILKGKEISFFSNPEAKIKVLPSLAAYIGADITAGLASVKPPRFFKNYLFIDIGTNGEMALVTPKKIWFCSTAAGPAFEGANISCGMSAVEGAINAYNAGGYQVIGNTSPAGLCGSGLIDVVAYLLEKDIIDNEGNLEKDFELTDNTKGVGLKINQQDIRELQLAKAAIRAGISVLLRKASLEAKDIDGLFLAGGFGCFLDVANAVKTGMIPPQLEAKTIPLGNTSATGALLALLSEDYDKNINDIILKACHFELSDDEDFMMDFVMNMSFGQ